MKIIKIDDVGGEKDNLLNFLNEIKSNEQGKIIDSQLIDYEKINFSEGDNNRLIDYFSNNHKLMFVENKKGSEFEIINSFIKNCRYGEDENIKEPFIIIFDSSANLGNSLDKGYLRKLIERGMKRENIIIVGARNLDAEEIIYARDNGIKLISMNQIYSNIEDACDIIMEQASERDKEVMIYVNLDVIDKAFSPGSFNSGVGGISTREILYLVQRLNRLRNLKCIFINSIDVEKDDKYDNFTTKLCAKLISEFI